MPKPRFASALSVDPDSSKAEEQVVEAIRDGLADAAPDLVTVFVSHHHGAALEELGPRLKAATGAEVLIGCTGESIIGAGREVEQQAALSVWAAHLPETRVRRFSIQARPVDGSFAFDGAPAIERPEETSLLLLADPFSFPMDEYLRKLNEEYPRVPAVGGMASGGMGPGQNLILTGEGMLAQGACGVALEGGIEVRSVVSQGCRPVGKPWVVTGCQEHLLTKLGGHSALEVMMKTLKEMPPEDAKLFQHGPFIGLAIDATRSEFERGDFLVRGITGIHSEERAFAVADVLRRGMTVQFLVRDAASASEDLSQLMATQGGGALAREPQEAGALLFSCNGRGSRMFESPNHDVTRVREGLAADVPVAGFFAMGEIGPIGGKNFLHGFTASVAVFRPRDPK